MIIGDKREEVIRNIAAAAEKGAFYDKVEVNDPNLSIEESTAIIENYLKNRKTLPFRIKTLAARTIANLLGAVVNKNTEIIGMENAMNIKDGAVVTCNHFSPLDNTVVRTFVRKLHKKRINIVSQETNLAMKGFIGFLMNYADIIPIAEVSHYLKNEFPQTLYSLLSKGEYLLIYPEQEMWFHYKKPRPPKRGAYYYAAKCAVPVISLFVEQREIKEKDTEEFYKVKYVLHVLPTLYPDPNKTVRQNSIEMQKRDEEQKKELYERIYGEPLDYSFEAADIAGWVGG